MKKFVIKKLQLFFPYSISVPQDLPMFHTLWVLTNENNALKRLRLWHSSQRQPATVWQTTNHIIIIMLNYITLSDSNKSVALKELAHIIANTSIFGGEFMSINETWVTLGDDIPMGMPFDDFMLAYKYAHNLAEASTLGNAIDDLSDEYCVEYTMSNEKRNDIPHADGVIIASSTYADGSGEIALLPTAGFLAVYDISESDRPFILSKVSYADGKFKLTDEGEFDDANDVVSIVAKY